MIVDFQLVILTLTIDVEILQFFAVVTDGQMEHQQLLGVALSRAVHQRAGEVVDVLLLVGGGLAESVGSDPPSLPPAGEPWSSGAGTVMSGGWEIPGASHSHLAVLTDSLRHGLAVVTVRRAVPL